MVRLIEKPGIAAEDVTIGEVRVLAPQEGRVTSIAPFKGQEGPVSAALHQAFGIGFPAIGAHIQAGNARLVWSGRGRMLLIGAEAPDLNGRAAVTDQTGAEAVVQVTGPAASDVLARLVPMDLRGPAFSVGSTARTMVAHMTATVSRIGEEAYELRVMRSMAQTLWHDVTQSAELLAARP